eukprot:TRINITY_DN121409_c0_g1_i1.p1 TRINITY_DN121409_c0_g1~~TRINITY_DN121409_c0_g1_i1.p1  ORF type:complete len:627 (+),score=156.11 TRINITY_DN121409_c0_g1_i1:122-2002(+)
MFKRRRAAFVIASLCLGASPALAVVPWPFGDAGDDPFGGSPFGDVPHVQVVELHGVGGRGGGLPGGLPGLPMELLGMPVLHGGLVVEGGFGFDPWEDLHNNMQRVVHEKLEPQPPGSLDPPAMMIEQQLGGLLDIFGGDHFGQVGRSQGSFQVDTDAERFRISSMLPGYHLDSQHTGKSKDPLSVKVLGRRSLVVSGTHKAGMVTSQWQRSFALPKRCDVEKVSVTYNANSGNLTVVVPLLPAVEGESDDQQDSEEDDELADLPPALQAMRSGMQGLMQGLVDGPQRQQAKRKKQFLAPEEELGDIFNEIFGMMDQMHPRYHPPAGGDRPVPEDAEVSFAGCFAEDQIAKAELKYYGDNNAASFNAMYWHAAADHVPYFSMARHDRPLGHAFTFRNFTHEKEEPRWGTYDGCGSRCEDEDSHWCGCANEGARGFGNEDCQPTEKRFAVYKIVHESTEVKAKAVDDSEAGTPELPAARSRQAGPYWQLSDLSDDEDDLPGIEIVLPKGTVAQPKGRDVVFYNATRCPLGDDGKPVPCPEGYQTADGQPEDLVEKAAGASSSETTTTQAPSESTATPVGKVRLPVGVDPEACSVADSTGGAGDTQVLRCALSKGDVRKVDIKVISDEL